jgi:hypothetical protein
MTIELETFLPAVSISAISSSDNLRSPAAMYPRILDSVWEVVIGIALQSVNLTQRKQPGQGDIRTYPLAFDHASKT